MKAQRATSATLAAGKKPALTSKTNTSTTSSTGSAASSSTKSSLLQQQQQQQQQQQSSSSSSFTSTTPFLDLIDYTFSNSHLISESNFNSFKLASATFGETTGKGNTTSTRSSEYHHKFICGREIGKGSYSKIFTIENTCSNSENLSSTSSLSLSSLSTTTTLLSSSTSSPPLALRLTSSNLMSRLDRENQILKIIHLAQQSSRSSSLINTNVVRVFGAGSLRPTDQQQQKQNFYNRSAGNNNNNNNNNNNRQDVLNNNNHAFSAIHLIELLRSETLYQLMTQVGSAFTIIDVYEIMLGCAQAVNELHNLDIVHRDVKLDNFVFANNNNNTNTRHMIKLIDFGTAATVSSSTSTTNLPPEELNCGTPAYMSVEAARNVLGTSSTKQQLTKAVDNWALGIIFYSLLTMSSPWKLEHKQQQQQQQQSSSTTATRTASSRSNRGDGAAARGIMSLPPTPQGTADTKQQSQQSQPQQQMSQSQIMMHRIVKCDWHWPPVEKQRHNANLNQITSKDAKQIVESLLQPDPSKRMTSDQLVLKLRQMISKEENNAGSSSSSSRAGGVRSMTQNKENGGNSSMFGISNNNNINTNRSGAIVRFLELKSNNSLTSTASYFQQQQQSQQQSSQSQSQQQQPRQSLLLMMSKPPLPVSSTSSSSAPNNNNDKLQQDAAATTRTSNSTTTTAAVSASPQARKATLLIPPVLTEQEQEQEKPLPSRKSSSLSKKKSSTGNTTVVSPVVTSVADNTDAAATTADATSALAPAVPLNKTEYNKLLKEYNKARKIITDEEKEAWEWIPYLHEANMKQAKHAHTFKKKVLKVDDDGEGFYCDQCSKLCTPPKDKKDLTSKHKDEFCSMHCYGCDMDVCMECYDTYMSRRTCSHCQKKFSWLKDIAEHDCSGAATKKESGKRRQRNENDDENENENDEKEETATTKKTSTTRGGRRSRKVVGFVNSEDDDGDDDALGQGDDGVTRTKKNRKDDDDNNANDTDGPKKPFNDADANTQTAK